MEASVFSCKLMLKFSLFYKEWRRYHHRGGWFRAGMIFALKVLGNSICWEQTFFELSQNQTSIHIVFSSSSLCLVKNRNENFRIGNDPPPLFGSFPKIHQICTTQASLKEKSWNLPVCSQIKPRKIRMDTTRKRQLGNNLPKSRNILETRACFLLIIFNSCNDLNLATMFWFWYIEWR